VCEAHGLYGQCKCTQGFRGYTCTEKCPVDTEGAICSGNGSCDRFGKCVCYGTFGGKSCELKNRVIDLTILSEREDAAETAHHDSEIPAALASHLDVPAARFGVESTEHMEYGRLVKVMIKDTPNASDAVFGTEAALWATRGEWGEDPETILSEESSTTEPSASQLADQVKVMAEAEGSALKSGPLSSLQRISVEAPRGCSEDKFWSCVDGSCMPKSGLDLSEAIPASAQCCAFDQESGTGTHCPPDDKASAKLTKCVAHTVVTDMSGKSPIRAHNAEWVWPGRYKYSCEAPAESCGFIPMMLGDCSSCSATATSSIATMVLFVMGVVQAVLN